MCARRGRGSRGDLQDDRRLVDVVDSSVESRTHDRYLQTYSAAVSRTHRARTLYIVHIGQAERSLKY